MYSWWHVFPPWNCLSQPFVHIIEWRETGSAFWHNPRTNSTFSLGKPGFGRIPRIAFPIPSFCIQSLNIHEKSIKHQTLQQTPMMCYEQNGILNLKSLFYWKRLIIDFRSKWKMSFSSRESRQWSIHKYKLRKFLGFTRTVNCGWLWGLGRKKIFTFHLIMLYYLNFLLHTL